MNQPVSPSARRNSSNMQARRERILDEARRLVIEGGVENLNMRNLAQAADVAVRTIYSLIGAKEDILAALYGQYQTMFLAQVGERKDLSPLDLVEVSAITTSALCRENEDYNRAAYIAFEHLAEKQPDDEGMIAILAEGHKFLTAGFQACADAGLMRREVPADLLGGLAFQAYRIIFKQWAVGQIPLHQLRKDVLVTAYVILLSDATSDFRSVILEKLNKERAAA